MNDDARLRDGFPREGLAQEGRGSGVGSSVYAVAIAPDAKTIAGVLWYERQWVKARMR